MLTDSVQNEFADILWRDFTNRQVGYWRFDGLQYLDTRTVVTAMDAGWQFEAIGDFDGDGREDLLWRDTQGNVQMWLVNAQYNNYDIQTLKLQSTGALVPTVGAEWKLVGVEDFSGDGKSDIVWRHQTGFLVMWNMDGATITQQSQSVSNTEVNNLSRQTLGTASKADFVDLTGVRLAIGSDSGESPNDWITNVRNPGISGVTDAGNQVSLFANNRLIGQTTAATTGIWSIVASALDDGVYSLSTQVKTTTGGTITQTIGRKLTIDGTAPELVTDGLVDGVAWTPQDQLKAILKDIDPKAKVEYQITNGQLQFSAVLDATLTNIDGTTKTGNLNLKTLSEMGFVAQTDGTLSKRAEIALKVTDRAGNIRTQTLKGMVLNLSDLTDESYLLGRSNSGSTSGGTADSKTPPAGTWVPQATVGTTPNQALYIGPGGAWGYAQAGTGTGAGGNGIAVGSIGWVPASQYNPTTGTGGTTTTPPLPPVPTLPTNIPALLDYVPALELIFKTAIDVLSNAGATAAKRSILNNAQWQLVSAGRVVQEYGLYDVMQQSLSGVYKSAYVAGGKLATAAAVQLGWKLAQDLAKSPVSTKLQSFEATLLAATYGAIKSSGGNLTATQATELREPISTLAKDYARLNPLPEQSSILEGYRPTSFLDILWNWGGFHDTVSTIPSTGVGSVITHLKSQLQGQVSVKNALQFVDRLIQASIRVETLHQPVDGNNQFPSYIKYGGFLRELTELGFEIARVNPTTTAGVNAADEWIETLLEGGSVLSAAEGLGHTFDGLELNKSGSSVGMAQLGKTLDCAGDLVKASRLIDDTSIRDKFQSAVLLSSIVGLADNYKPHTNNIETQGLFDSPFSVLASTGDLQATANQLKKWQLLSEQGANTSEVEVPLSSITLFNGRPAFFEDVKIFGTPAIYLDQPNSGFGVDPSIQDGALATFGSWRDKIRIYRANGKADTYSATSSSRSIWLFTKAIDLVSASDKQIASDKYIPLYLGDRISSVLSLQFNKPNGKFPTTWLDKLAVSKDYAIAEAPRYFSTEVIQIWNSVIQHPFLAGAGLAAMGGVHAFAPPVAVALDAAMMAFFGAESVFHLGSFFIKAIKSQDEAGLRDASNELLKFVGSAINAATSGAGVFAANKISKGATAAETLSQVGGWLQTSASLGSEFLKAFSWDNVLALRSSTDALKSFFLLPALRSMVRADVRRFMQFGEEASVSFLSSELPRLLSNPIEGLRSFGDKWNVLGQIVERLEQLPDVATALGQYPRNLAGVLNAGVDGINAIQSRVEIMGDIPVLWAKRLSLMDSPLEANRTLEGLSYVVRKRQELGLNTLKPGIVTNNVGYGNFNVTLANGGVFNTGREALIAVSGPQSPAGTVAAPLLRRLTQSSSRPTDSEAKILENIADIIIQSGAQADGQGKYSGVKGTVQLFTERKPCDECTPLIKILWKNLFPNVEITEVLHGPRYLPGDLQKDLNNTDNFTNVLK